MIQPVFSVYDVKSGAYGNPLVIISKAAAIRSFSDSVNDPQSDFSKHPEDYSLNYIGEWDPLTGLVSSAKVPEVVITARECVAASA